MAKYFDDNSLSIGNTPLVQDQQNGSRTQGHDSWLRSKVVILPIRSSAG